VVVIYKPRVLSVSISVFG